LNHHVGRDTRPPAALAGASTEACYIPLLQRWIVLPLLMLVLYALLSLLHVLL
jgi:hypothetical protein